MVESSGASHFRVQGGLNLGYILKMLLLQLILASVLAHASTELCFSPEGHCDQKLIDKIKTAESSIQMAVFDINLDQLVHQVLVKALKIKNVRVVVDRRQAQNPHSLVSTLIKGGAQVRIGRQRGIMHNKFTVVDGKWVETGSFNYTNGASEKNNENQIYIDDPAVVARFQERFEKIWSEATPANIGPPRRPSSRFR